MSRDITSERCEAQVCGSCRFNKWNPGDIGDFWCNNPESDNYTDYIEYGDSCEEWEGKE